MKPTRKKKKNKKKIKPRNKKTCFDRKLMKIILIVVQFDQTQIITGLIDDSAAKCRRISGCTDECSRAARQSNCRRL